MSEPTQANIDAAREMILSQARMAALLPRVAVEGLLDALARADSIGPIFQPTEWIQRRGELEWITKVAEAYATFQGVVLEVVAEQGGIPQ